MYPENSKYLKPKQNKYALRYMNFQKNRDANNSKVVSVYIAYTKDSTQQNRTPFHQ